MTTAAKGSGTQACRDLRVQKNADRRHKLAHVFELLPADVAEVCQTPSVFVVYQPIWFALGYDAETVTQHRSLVEGGASVCYGSDWDITALSPLKGLSVALGSEKKALWDDAVPMRTRVARMLRLYTLEAARAMWLENCSGTIEVGKFADLCIVDRDIFEMGAEFLSAPADRHGPPPVEVMATISRGFIIFRREEAAGPPPLERLYTNTSRQENDGVDDSLFTPEDLEFLCSPCRCVHAPGLDAAACC